MGQNRAHSLRLAAQDQSVQEAAGLGAHFARLCLPFQVREGWTRGCGRPDYPFKFPSKRDHKALKRGTLGGLGSLVLFEIFFCFELLGGFVLFPYYGS